MAVHPRGDNPVNFASRLRRTIEYALVTAGAILLLVFIAAYAHRVMMVRAEMKRFKDAMALENRKSAPASESPRFPEHRDAATIPSEPAGHSVAHGSGRTPYAGHAIAILRIPKLHLEVPVLDGTDAITLNRGVGRIRGTAFPGQGGNIAIAGHRDGFFRGLKDIHAGDEIELLAAQRTDIYIVDRTVIVDPDDTSVL
ncbi:MAG TPA: class D sortase, partial [Candidatus Angelobacter sp.]|nr:class D sortase [Candidatus Angelobacter sp.]